MPTPVDDPRPDRASHPTIDRIAEAIELNRLVAVCGAGVTASAVAKGTPGSSWIGLIEDGLNTVLRTRPKMKAWFDAEHAKLIAARNTKDLIEVADAVFNNLGTPGFQLWLDSTVGELELDEGNPDSAKLIDAILNLGVPIATTNYDTLIEHHSRRQYLTWQDPTNMQEALRGGKSSRKFVLHLHGVWMHEQTIIFGSRSYGRIEGHEPAQEIQKLVSFGTSMLLVGAGGTLKDPNLGHVISELRRLIPGTKTEHYLLCKESEIERLDEEYADTAVTPVSFETDDYNDLPSFLAKISSRVTRRNSNNTGPKEEITTAALSPGTHNHHNAPRLPLLLKRNGELVRLTGEWGAPRLAGSEVDPTPTATRCYVSADATVAAVQRGTSVWLSWLNRANASLHAWATPVDLGHWAGAQLLAVESAQPDAANAVIATREATLLVRFDKGGKASLVRTLPGIPLLTAVLFRGKIFGFPGSPLPDSKMRFELDAAYSGGYLVIAKYFTTQPQVAYSINESADNSTSETELIRNLNPAQPPRVRSLANGNILEDFPAAAPAGHIRLQGWS